MFSQIDKLTSIYFSKKNWCRKYITNFSRMFFNDENLILVDISNFNTENLNNLDYLFFGCISLNSIKLQKSNNLN